jgi:hypothetical protein
VTILALLSWFDERPAQLARLVSSLAGAGVGHLVALDGAYALFPGAAARSPGVQARMLRRVAHAHGIDATILVPDGPWRGGEVEKRTALFAAAHRVAVPGRDWLWVIDADEVVTAAGWVRDGLEATCLDVAEVLFGDADGVSPVRRLFRAHRGGIRVDGFHGRYVDGGGRVLWDASGRCAQVEAASLWDVRMRHVGGRRATDRTEKRMTYYHRRDRLGAEAV